MLSTTSVSSNCMTYSSDIHYILLADRKSFVSAQTWQFSVELTLVVLKHDIFTFFNHCAH